MRRPGISVGIALLTAIISMGTAAGAPSEGCVAWEMVPVPGTDQSDNFTAIDGVSAEDFWAVGNPWVGARAVSIFHWDGNGWIVPPREPAIGGLEGVDALATDDAWAVGDGPLTMHWDGTIWSVVPSPDLEGILYGVSGSSASDVWAVGAYDYNQGLIIHWDGSSWTIVPHVQYPEGQFMWDVLAISPDDAWAVGQRDDGFDARPIIQHWDGSEWADMPIPYQLSAGYLYDVDGISSEGVWAVGQSYVAGALVYRWDGVRWTRVNRMPYRFQGQLRGVSALARDDLWVAGQWTSGGPPINAHWNGQQWVFPSVVRENSWFNSIKAFSHTEVWAVGGGGFGVRVDRYVGCP